MKRPGWAWVTGWVTISDTLTVQVSAHINIIADAPECIGEVVGEPIKTFYQTCADRGWKIRRARVE